MDEEGVREYLRKNKRRGIDRNIAFVKEFEAYLRDHKGGKTLETATPKDIEDFANWDGKQTRSRNTVYVSAIKYYYGFLKNQNIAKEAQNLINRIMKKRRETRPLTWVERWMLGLMDALNEYVDEETRVKIQQRCGRSCLSMPSQQRTVLKKYNTLYESSKDLDEFLDRLDKEDWIQRDGNVVYATMAFGRCVCPIVGNIPLGQLPPTWCNCFSGYLKALFEDTLGRPVDVVLIESLRSGAKQCTFRITL